MLSILSAFSLCACRIACKYGSISRFKGVFRGFYSADVYLYGLRSLRGLWGFCARVELGGLKDCGVFAFHFVFLSSAFHLLRLSSGALSLLSSSCPLVLSCLFLCPCGFCFFFPFGQNEKGRICFALFLCLVLVSLF